ncbi:MAG: hypothetical protein KGH98_00245 [Candidatus Micrarchaeota archaeon]|nr:hypothetical protein [Candidatus Micrarchaeota archaeon]
MCISKFGKPKQRLQQSVVDSTVINLRKMEDIARKEYGELGHLPINGFDYRAYLHKKAEECIESPMVLSVICESRFVTDVTLDLIGKGMVSLRPDVRIARTRVNNDPIAADQFRRSRLLAILPEFGVGQAGQPEAANAPKPVEPRKSEAAKVAPRQRPMKKTQSTSLRAQPSVEDGNRGIKRTSDLHPACIKLIQFKEAHYRMPTDTEAILKLKLISVISGINNGRYKSEGVSSYQDLLRAAEEMSC